MKRIFKSLLFQLKGRCLWKKIWVVLLLLLGVSMAASVFLEGGSGTVSKALAQGDMESFSLLVLAFVAMAGAEIFGNDFADRTINHELLSGHSRAEVYFARALAGILVSVAGALTLVFVPPAVFSALGYYGDTMELPGLLLRLLLLAFPVCRLCCEMIFLTCILKNAFLSGAVGVVLLMMEKMVAGILDNCNPYLMSGTNVQRLFEFGSWFTYSLKDLKTCTVYDSMPTVPLALGTAAGSVLVGAVVLYLGYEFFRRDDLR